MWHPTGMAAACAQLWKASLSVHGLRQRCLLSAAAESAQLLTSLTYVSGRATLYLSFCPQELQLQWCSLAMLPAVVSTLTGLTCLECACYDFSGPISVPGWLSRLASLRKLVCYPTTHGSMPPAQYFHLPCLESLVSRWVPSCPACIESLQCAAQPDAHAASPHATHGVERTPCHKQCNRATHTQDLGCSDLGPATRLLSQLKQLTFGHGGSAHVNLGILRGGHGWQPVCKCELPRCGCDVSVRLRMHVQMPRGCKS